jgi:cell wall-associated NlpC family hydrolase
LVLWVYGRLGFAVPQNAAALYSTGRPVSASHLKPGDLVFFHGLGHVGIYIGNGRMIHAPQTGESVEIETLGERSGAIEGARRVAA